MGCEANRLAPHVSAPSAAKATQPHLLANLHQGSEASLAKPEPVFQPAESTTWVQEDEPGIEVTGPVFFDPFAAGTGTVACLLCRTPRRDLREEESLE